MRIRGKKAVFFIGGLLTIFFPASKPTPAGASIEKAPTRLFLTLEEALPAAGRPVLLVFFSTTCRVCWDDLFEAKAMIEADDFPVELVGVSLEKREDLESFLKKYSFPYQE